MRTDSLTFNVQKSKHKLMGFNYIKLNKNKKGKCLEKTKINLSALTIK